MRLVLATGLTE
jgi:hypothetical protein